MILVPDQCSRCGAPISWDNRSEAIECEYCGKINRLIKSSSPISNISLLNKLKIPSYSSVNSLLDNSQYSRKNTKSNKITLCYFI